MSKIRLTALISIILLSLIWPSFAWAEELTLEKAIELGMTNNRSLLKFQASRSAANWGVANSVSYWLPKVSYNWSWSKVDDETYDLADAQYNTFRQFDPNTERTLWKNNYANSISVIQPIFNGGQEFVAIHSSAIARKGAALNEEDSRAATLLEVKQAYYDAQKAKALVKLMEESLALANDSYRLAKDMFDVGSATKSDVLRWEAESAGAKGALAAQQNAHALAMINLARVIGGPVDQKWTLPEMVIDIPQDVTGSVLDAAPISTESALPVGDHPAVAAMWHNVKLARTEVESGVGKFLPNANFSYNYEWDTNDTPGPDEDTAWTMGVMVEIPLFQGFGSITGVGQAAKNAQSVRREYEQYQRTFVQQAFASHMNLKTALLMYDSSKKAEESSRENLKIVQSRMGVGIANNLQLLDARVAYQKARSDLISSVADFQVAFAQWEYFTTKMED